MNKFRILKIVAVIGVVALLLLVLEKPVRQFMAKFHLLPEPEPFTELYFEDHLKLPAKRDNAGKNYQFRFTVHNLEYRERDYLYEVKEVEGERETRIAEGGFSLKHDKFKTIPVEYGIATGSGRVKIQTCLTDNDQCVHFWME